MSPRSSDSHASSSKQKKKSNDSPPSAPLESPSTPAASSPAPITDANLASSPALAPAQVPVPVPVPSSIHGPSDASNPTVHEVHAATLTAAASNPPRVFVASTLKPLSAIDTVTSTISALSQHANRGISSLIAAHSTAPNPVSPLVTASADHSTPLRTDGSVSPIYDAFHNAGAPPDPARIEAALHHANQADLAAKPTLPRVRWSRWDRLPLKSLPLKWAPVLLSYFDDGTFQILLVQDRQISELLCLPNAANALQDRATSSALSEAQLLTALVRHPTPDIAEPQLLIVLQEPDNSTQLLAYSLVTHQIHASVQLQHVVDRISDTVEHVDDHRSHAWPQVDSQCNERFFVLSFASPASIHVLSSSTLNYIRPPILDASSPSPDRPSPISLSHRVLAYACTASHDIAPIRSDARKTSNASYHDPSRPFAGTQADASGRVGEMRDNLFETSAHVGDAARRIRGGVMSGVRTLGEWGSSYWPQAGSPPPTAAFSPPQPSLLSQSAPHTAHPSRFASSASSSPMLLAVDGARSVKRLSTGAAPGGVSSKQDGAAVASNSSSAVHAGCVRVLDLGSDARTLCTFAPSGNAVALTSFSPCGRLILTADSLGHAFHVFELPLSGSFGSAASPVTSTVLHRYKLMRGITTADVVHAEWSHDAQWIAVGTRSGTVHIYAINPFGGVPLIANHVQGKVKNPHVLQPFGVSLASVARSSRPSHSSTQQESVAKSANASGTNPGLVTATAVPVRFAPPSFLLRSAGVRAADSDDEASTPFELLTNDSRGATVTLHSVRCWTTRTRAPSSSISNEDVHATSPESKHRLGAATSPRSSGLTQMMRNAGEGLLHGQQAPRLQADCVRIALWDHLAPESTAVTKQNMSPLFDHASAPRPLDRSEPSLLKPLASVAKAEIETYSQSQAILPSSIFLSRQTFFHARARNSKAASVQPGSGEEMRCVQRRGSRVIQVRKTVRMVSREPSSESPRSFDDSLAGALDQMSFDPDRLPPRSASAHIPSFPQGQRGRSSGWTTGSSIPIRIVAGGLGGIYRAGKELGRGVEMARRRTSGASGAVETDGPVATTASISFDREDDVDLLAEDEETGQAPRRHYRRTNGIANQVDHGSIRSDTSLLSALRNDEPSRGSQPSSAETPSTRFSEAEDAAADSADVDAEECDWDAIEASRSPAAPEAAIFDVMDSDDGRHQSSGKLDQVSLDDDFTVGMLEEDSGEATMSHSRASLSPVQETRPKMSSAKELVYALPAGGSTRSSILSQSSGLTTTVEGKSDIKVSQSSPRDSSPSNSESGDSGSQSSGGSGLLCEGSKEMHTSENSPAARVADLDASPKMDSEKPLEATSVVKPISTSGGGKKKKKKGGR